MCDVLLEMSTSTQAIKLRFRQKFGQNKSGKMAVYNLLTRIVHRKSHKNELIKALKLENLRSSAKSLHPNSKNKKKPQQQQNKKMTFNKY